jgi:hypothetical protein
MYNHDSLDLNTFSKIIIVFIITLIEFVTFTLIFYFIFVTFGASVIENLYETLFFSILSCLFCVMPSIVFVKHENPFILIQRLFIKNDCKNSVENACSYVCIAFIIGSWFGALFIPLGIFT